MKRTPCSAHRCLQRLERGSGWIEFYVVVALIGVLALGVLTALSDAERQTEQVAFGVTVRQMRSELRLKVASLMTANRMQEIGRLAESNPVALLVVPPAGYAGERDGTDVLEPGQWWFDKNRRELIYRFRHSVTGPGMRASAKEGRLSIRHVNRSSVEVRHPAEAESVELVVQVIHE